MPVFAEQPSLPNSFSIDHPGIKWNWAIKAENYTFTVTTISNYDMKNVNFDKIHKELIFSGKSTHNENIAEIEIPRNLIGGNLTVIQDGKQISPLIIPSTNSSTVVLKFNQTGSFTTNIVGTTYLPEFSGIDSLVMITAMGTVIFTLKIRRF